MSEYDRERIDFALDEIAIQLENAGVSSEIKKLFIKFDDELTKLLDQEKKGGE